MFAALTGAGGGQIGRGKGAFGAGGETAGGPAGGAGWGGMEVYFFLWVRGVN